MSLRRTFLIAFAAVAVAVAALVGALSYDVTATNLHIEVDQSLATAATAVAGGGTLTPPPGVTSVPDPDGDGDGDGDGDRRTRSLLLVQTGQRIATDGAITVVLGAGLPVDTTDLALAARGRSGATRYRTETLSSTTYRVLTETTDGGAVMVGRSLDVTDHVLAELAVEIFSAGLAVLVAAAAAGLLIARRITRRLVRLTEAAELVSTTGRLDVPVTAAGRDEVGRLGTAFDTMLAELARSRDDQRRLVQDAGHELRTPLTSLRTNISVLRRYAELDPDDRARLLDDLDGEARELTTLADELVELAGDRRATEPARPVDVTALAHRLADRYERRTGRAVTVGAGSAVVVEGRPQSLERALSNLLDNAVKFDPDGEGPVEVEVGVDRIQVLDRGPGIDPADAPHVFERFYRATSARGLTGSGLGLAIVAEIARLHGGHTYATARTGGGSIVGFTVDPQAR